MKIHFLEVTGSVAIDDRYSCQGAVTGMTLETEAKSYLIVTGDNSFANLIIESKTVSLGPNSFLNVNWPHPRQMRGAAYDLRILVGKLWSMIDRHELTADDDANAVVGVRG